MRCLFCGDILTESPAPSFLNICVRAIQVNRKRLVALLFNLAILIHYQPTVLPGCQVVLNQPRILGEPLVVDADCLDRDPDHL